MGGSMGGAIGGALLGYVLSGLGDNRALIAKRIDIFLNSDWRQAN